jgi:hypothetical protein
MQAEQSILDRIQRIYLFLLPICPPSSLSIVVFFLPAGLMSR